MSRNQLIKTHGGAVPVPTDSPTAAFEQRMQRNFDAKRRIARVAARLITDNQSVVFDSGSTLLQLAMQMPPVKNVVVATNAMNIAQYLMYRPGLDVHMIGGRVYPSTVSTIVADLDAAVGGLLAHQAFVGAHAIDQAFDVVDVSEDIARTKRNLVRMARRVIVLADSSKWDIGASSKAFSLSRVDLVITDEGLPRDPEPIGGTGSRGPLRVTERLPSPRKHDQGFRFRSEDCAASPGLSARLRPRQRPPPRIPPRSQSSFRNSEPVVGPKTQPPSHPSEAETFWTDFLRSLKSRGLQGVKLVISDAHTASRSHIARAPPGDGVPRQPTHFQRLTSGEGWIPSPFGQPTS